MSLENVIEEERKTGTAIDLEKRIVTIKYQVGTRTEGEEGTQITVVVDCGNLDDLHIWREAAKALKQHAVIKQAVTLAVRTDATDAPIRVSLTDKDFVRAGSGVAALVNKAGKLSAEDFLELQVLLEQYQTTTE